MKKHKKKIIVIILLLLIILTIYYLTKLFIMDFEKVKIALISTGTIDNQTSFLDTLRFYLYFKFGI